MKRKPVQRSDPDFITAPNLAALLSVGDVKTLDRLIAVGEFPPPWLWIGPRKRLWRADHYRAFHDTGRWPKEAFKGFPRAERPA